MRVHIHFIAFTVQAPILSVNSTTATTISLSWTSAGSVVDSYEVIWQRDTSGDCPNENNGSMFIADGSTSYNITRLEENSSYNITVIVRNSIGMATSNLVTGFTKESGTAMSIRVLLDQSTCNSFTLHIFISSIYCSNFCECI